MGVIRLTEDMFKAKEEKLPEFNKSIFQECYVQASKVLVEIVKNNSNVKQDISENKNTSINKSVEYHNNIIAFAGERGSGKTSSMVSFHKSLECKSDFINSLEDTSDLKKNYKELVKYHFHLPYMIDPSVLTHKDSIIEIIVGRMFEEVSNDNHYDDVVRKRELIKRFDKVFKNLRIINAEQNSIFEQSQDNLEVLMDLASVIDLKNNLYQLFECYMEYMNKNGLKKDNYLVLTIDDLDMNMASADKMIEDIRKYLVIPNVIILIALRMPQMVQVVKQRNMMQLRETTEFYIHLQDKNFIERHHYDINTKTQMYLDKIFPETHVIDMPNIWSDDTQISLEGSNDEIPINKLIKELLKYNVGYLIGSDIHLRTILPYNLRDFIELVSLLDYKIINQVNTFQKYELKKDKILTNIQKLYSYFLKKSAYYINNIKLKTILENIFKMDITILNKEMLIFLNDILYIKYDIDNTSIKDINPNSKDKFYYINQISKHRFNIEKESVNIGDIICLINIFNQLNLDKEERIFLEYFKMLYSLRFIEFICSKNFLSDKDRSIYDSFVFDTVGRYFVSTKSRFAEYLRWPIKIDENNINKLHPTFKYNNIYYPIKDKDNTYPRLFI